VELEPELEPVLVLVLEVVLELALDAPAPDSSSSALPAAQAMTKSATAMVSHESRCKLAMTGRLR